ncbi:hypothetical protein PGB34_15915 [Xenophilus arseniciresistens]|uniref:Uncharacterized protein n=1 Tax=Xenophilus arseniciresistens TaxID=1283306 RepID=A0AAE3NBJ4_9BURK|nr:hypothetical protein [Xenophilus arseniciresistens]MDA7417851.1 hypothetical protein [Xenophilus arseniciresistens]
MDTLIDDAVRELRDEIRTSTDQLFPDFVPPDSALGSAERASLHEAMGQCVARQVRPAFAAWSAEAFRHMFESRENLAAWVDFSHTPAGVWLLADLRARLHVPRGAAMAPPSERLADLGAEDRAALRAFLGSPAAQVLRRKKQAPAALSDATLDALAQQVIHECVVADEVLQLLEQLKKGTAAGSGR